MKITSWIHKWGEDMEYKPLPPTLEKPANRGRLRLLQRQEWKLTQKPVHWWKVKWSESHSVVSDSLWPHGLHSPWNSPGQNTGVGSLSLLWGIFPTQGSNPDCLHCRRILYQLSHKRIIWFRSASLLWKVWFLPWGLKTCFKFRNGLFEWHFQSPFILSLYPN